MGLSWPLPGLALGCCLSHTKPAWDPRVDWLVGLLGLSQCGPSWGCSLAVLQGRGSWAHCSTHVVRSGTAGCRCRCCCRHFCGATCEPPCWESEMPQSQEFSWRLGGEMTFPGPVVAPSRRGGHASAPAYGLQGL